MSRYVTMLLVDTHCTICDIPFAVPQDFWRRGEESGGAVWCPNGHKMTFGESRNERLARDLERAERRAKERLDLLAAEREAHAHTERRLRSTKAVVTKTKKRIAAGACPCCHERFPDLAEHMTAEHPGYGPAVGGEDD